MDAERPDRQFKGREGTDRPLRTYCLRVLEGWGRFVHRRRWVVLGASLVMLALSGVLLARGGELRNPDTIPSTESGRASALFDELPQPSGPPPGASFSLVFRSETLSVADAAYKQAVADAIAPLRADARVAGIRSYYDELTPQSGLLSRDGHGMLAFVQLKDQRSIASTYFDDLRFTAHVGVGMLEVFPDGGGVGAGFEFEGAERFDGNLVTPGTFEFLGMPALLGRVAQPADYEPGAPPVFVMRYKTWVTRFNADPKRINKIFVLNGAQRTLIGVMPPRFQFPEQAQLWMPAAPVRRPALLPRDATPARACREG